MASLFTVAQMTAAINAGQGVLWNGNVYTTVASLPTQAQIDATFEATVKGGYRPTATEFIYVNGTAGVGNDGTGAFNDPALPFATILAAATLAASHPGCEIVVYPKIAAGVYAPYTDVKVPIHQGSYFFHYGCQWYASAVGSLLINTGGAKTCYVRGFCDFKKTGAPGADATGNALFGDMVLGSLLYAEGVQFWNACTTENDTLIILQGEGNYSIKQHGTLPDGTKGKFESTTYDIIAAYFEAGRIDLDVYDIVCQQAFAEGGIGSSPVIRCKCHSLIGGTGQALIEMQGDEAVAYDVRIETPGSIRAIGFPVYACVADFGKVELVASEVKSDVDTPLQGGGAGTELIVRGYRDDDGSIPTCYVRATGTNKAAIDTQGGTLTLDAVSLVPTGTGAGISGTGVVTVDNVRTKTPVASTVTPRGAIQHVPQLA